MVWKTLSRTTLQNAVVEETMIEEGSIHETAEKEKETIGIDVRHKGQEEKIGTEEDPNETKGAVATIEKRNRTSIGSTSEIEMTDGPVKEIHTDIGKTVIVKETGQEMMNTATVITVDLAQDRPEIDLLRNLVKTARKDEL